MTPDYRVNDPSAIPSPSLLFFKDLIARNVAHAIKMAGGPARLRPHAKTHKTREVTRMLLAAGVTKHKCATPTEAAVLAGCGAPDVLIAYPPVGPNAGRLAGLARDFPETRFSTLIDDEGAAGSLNAAAAAAGVTVDVLLDLNVGQNRTGVIPGPAAVRLFRAAEAMPALRPVGLHVYDGHLRQADPAERAAAVGESWRPARGVWGELGPAVRRVVCGGTPTFPIHAARPEPEVECSPGTFTLFDENYSQFPDLAGFTPAALLLTRVVSRPAPGLLTFDLGSKAVAPDRPVGERCRLVNVPDAEPVSQSEEHLVVRVPDADRYPVGFVGYAVPGHVCVSVALHRSALVVGGGAAAGEWDVAARDRG